MSEKARLAHELLQWERPWCDLSLEDLRSQIQRCRDAIAVAQLRMSRDLERGGCEDPADRGLLTLSREDLQGFLIELRARGQGE